MDCILINGWINNYMDNFIENVNIDLCGIKMKDAWYTYVCMIDRYVWYMYVW